MLGKMAHRRTMDQKRMALVKKMMLEKPKTNQLKVKRRMKPKMTTQVTKKLEKVRMTTEHRKMRQMKKKHLTILLSPSEFNLRIDVTYTAALLANLKVISLCLY